MTMTMTSDIKELRQVLDRKSLLSAGAASLSLAGIVSSGTGWSGAAGAGTAHSAAAVMLAQAGAASQDEAATVWNAFTSGSLLLVHVHIS